MKKLSERVQQKHHMSMRWRMMGILLICWMIPFAFMIGILGVYLVSNHSDMIVENFCDQLEFNNKICVERLNGVIAASREASYDGELLRTNSDYLGGEISYVKASRQYKDYLTAKYQKNDAISCAVLWFDPEDPNDMYSIYNERANGAFQQIRDYREQDHLVVADYAETLETRIGFLKRGKRLYLIRNLVDSSFQTQGTLVFCLNRKYCFDSLSEYPLADGVYTRVGDARLELIENERLKKWDSGQSPDTDIRYEWLGNRLYVSSDLEGDNYELHTSMILQKEVTKYPFYGYQYVLAAMVLSLFPMLLLMMHVFRTHVSDPVEVLSEGARHVEKGELGYQIEDVLSNLEFTYLRDSFNQMSQNLKLQFDRIYQEEIALREARIMALQSHINPHFMNNTLEIINWEARLGGNVKVSKMIEALSTMLDAAMDRRKRPQVRLVEEMGYVNSYLYIMKERLGKRLRVEIELPEELMDYLVPRLILQPVIENAIEHGVVQSGSGVVQLSGYSDGAYLCLETINDGELSGKDQERIARLLDPQYHTGKEPEGNLGIANVNQRLRILYGEPCGLTISDNKNGQITAKLTMPLHKTETELVEMNKTKQ